MSMEMAMMASLRKELEEVRERAKEQRGNHREIEDTVVILYSQVDNLLVVNHALKEEARKRDKDLKMMG